MLRKGKKPVGESLKINLPREAFSKERAVDETRGEKELYRAIPEN